jgi:peptidoglycan/xylan/chitin deacetylase (PgdA/CDA1 family)
VKSILAILDEYSVPATWAVVGHLFFNQCSPDQHHRTEHIWDIDTFTDVNRDPLYYAPDLLDSIREAEVDHEIAGHSFSHSLFTDLSREEAQTELEAMANTAREHGVELESFVYPRNEIAHEDLLTDYGIKTFRGRTKGIQETIRSGVKSIISEPGSFFSFPHVTPQRTEMGVTCLPASRLLRDERWWFLQPLRLKRAIESLDTGDWVHLTVHPFNFLQQPQLLGTLRKLLSHVQKNTIEVVTMSDAHSIVNKSSI